jgi:hypothetical protein
MKRGKFWITYVTFLFVVVGALLLLIGFDDKITAKQEERDAHVEKYEPWVGERIVVGNRDTVMVMKYNKWRNEFLLEDGKSASPEMVGILMVR